MLKIAICDDIEQERKRLATLLTEYLDTQTTPAQVKTFAHPDELLSATESESFHIYILDIVMPMISGLELGREIRRIDREAQILYATTEPQFALNAYATNPINYLLKPIDKVKLFETLALAVSKVDVAEEQTFTLKTADSLRVVSLSDILCCEYQAHAVLLTLRSGEVVVSRTIRDSFVEYIASVVNNRFFLRCHNSFVVNMRYVERFAKDSFTLRGGKMVPIAKGQYQTVRDTYMDYLMFKGDLL